MTIQYIDARAIAWDTPLYPQAVAWLEANDIDPGDVLLDSHIEVLEMTIRYRGFVRVRGTKHMYADGGPVTKVYEVLKKVDPYPSLLEARRGKLQ